MGVQIKRSVSHLQPIAVEQFRTNIVLNFLYIIISSVYNVGMLEGFLTTRQASSKCGLSQAHIRLLLERGTVEGIKVGRDWLVKVNSLDHYMANRPKPGPRRRRRVRQKRN